MDQALGIRQGGPMTISQTSRVKLQGRSGLLAAAPALLGFHPRESLVMLCLVGPRREAGPVMRVDLPPDGEAPVDGSAARRFTKIADKQADEVALLCYTEESGTPKLVRSVITELQGAGIHIIDALRITGGRAWSIPAPPPGTSEVDFEDDDDGCAVPDANDPQVQAMAAAIAFNGRQVLPDRESLRQSIQGPRRSEARKITASLEAAFRGLLGAGHGPVERRRLEEMAWCAFDVALHQSACGTVGRATAAQISMLIRDTEIRDGLILRSIMDVDEPWLPMLISVARLLPDEHAAQVCAVLAIAAYRSGDGALAQVAVDRCLGVEPDHALALMMIQVMDSGLHPSVLREWLTPDDHVSRGTGG